MISMADLVSQFFEHKPIEHLLGQASRQKISTTIAGGIVNLVL
jgi:hypothetical protein